MHKASWMVVLSLLAAPVMADEKTIDPGLYDVVTTSLMGGASMGAPTTARMCLTAKDIANGLAPALEKNCKWVRNVAANGKLDYATTCPDSTMVETGTYTSTGYLLDGKITMKDGTETMVLETHIAAKRVKEKC